MSDTQALADTPLKHLRFPPGRLVATRNALDRLHPLEISQAILRHVAGDWGDLCPEDIRSNEEALVHGGRLFSAYGTGDSRFWIITEADRSVTTILLPEDY